MKKLFIDIETYCDLDLTEVSVYAYAAHPSFEILLFAYAYDTYPTELIDINSIGDIPYEIYEDLFNPDVLKLAHNANFEITCLSSFLKEKLSASQWFCTSVQASMAGYPGRLEYLTEALKLPSDEQKMKIGKSLIRYFCMPCAPTKKNLGRIRNLPGHDLGKWELFKEYCKRDVDAERAAYKMLSYYLISDFEREVWQLDQRINSRGVLVDKTLVINAIRFEGAKRVELEKELTNLTGIANANSVAQLKVWLQKQGVNTEALAKDDVSNLLKVTDSSLVKRVLEIRQQLSKTSIKKYNAMCYSLGWDSRIRGLFQYYGASRTGRWAGKLVQVQNLPKPELNDETLDIARDFVMANNYDKLDILFDVTSTLSQLIRTTFIAPKDFTFAVADFSAIEARVISWLADENWRNNVFAKNEDIYKASAAQMFKVPIENVTKEMRARGKVAELALGYQGATGALIQMGALEKGLKEEELPLIVSKWRQANKNIVRLWSEVESCVREAIEGRLMQFRNVKFIRYMGNLYIELPSGRRLSYVNAKIENGKITYWGVDQTKKIWCKHDSYGGKFVENIVQAIARDCLAEAMLKIEDNYPIVMHIHDEVVVEIPRSDFEIATRVINKIMQTTPEWAQGLILNNSLFLSDYYKKD